MFPFLSLKNDVASPSGNTQIGRLLILLRYLRLELRCYLWKRTRGKIVLILLPRFPTRPVRPIRWTYSSMSLGRSKLITCFTLEMSRPRAATCVKDKCRKGHSHTLKKAFEIPRMVSLLAVNHSLVSIDIWSLSTRILLPLTAVATRMGHFPDLNWLSASSRSLWERSPWILVQA